MEKATQNYGQQELTLLREVVELWEMWDMLAKNYEQYPTTPAYFKMWEFIERSLENKRDELAEFRIKMKEKDYSLCAYEPIKNPKWYNDDDEVDSFGEIVNALWCAALMDKDEEYEMNGESERYMRLVGRCDGLYKAVDLAESMLGIPIELEA